MNFICTPCKRAADFDTSSGASALFLKKRLHQDCKGDTHCDCQHRVRK